MTVEGAAWRVLNSRAMDRVSMFCVCASVVALALPACTATATSTCSSLEYAYATAKASYTSQHYGEASKLFEALSKQSQVCARTISYKNTGREFIGYEMLVAGEAAHWDKQNARARQLVGKAKALLRALHPAAVHDHELALILSRSEDEADRDLSGSWTLGVQ